MAPYRFKKLFTELINQRGILINSKCGLFQFEKEGMDVVVLSF